MLSGLIVGRQNRLIELFEHAGATSPAEARLPADLGCREGVLFRSLVDRGVFRSAGDGRYYLDSDEAADFVHRRHRILLLVLLILFVLMLLFVDFPA
jgi:hypothetical protein